MGAPFLQGVVNQRVLYFQPDIKTPGNCLFVRQFSDKPTDFLLPRQAAFETELTGQRMNSSNYTTITTIRLSSSLTSFYSSI